MLEHVPLLRGLKKFKMLKIFVFICCVYLANGHILQKWNRMNSRIVGGENAPEGGVPYQASLRTIFNFHFCGGSIINKRWILTAAHCTLGESRYTMKVVVGTNSLSSGGVHCAVEKVIIHQNFSMSSIENDVSVVSLTKNLVFNNLVQAIPLPTANTPGGAELTLTGWGTLSFPGSTPDKLQIIKLQSLSVAQCQQIYENLDAPEVYSSQICSLTKAGEGACHGDSGGPLVENGKVVGIVSWGMPCARGYPDVHTRVRSFNAWIGQSIAASNNTKV